MLAIFISRLKIGSPDEPVVRELLAPPQSLVYFNFGYRHVLADVFWLRSIQDFDYCEKKISTTECRGNDWLSQTLQLVTELSPDFLMAYSAGGMALTVIISDYQGASAIFDKGVSRFPKDWLLLFKAGYHALYEEKDQVKAARLLENAARNGAPDWVYLLSTRLYTEAGRREIAERLVAELQDSELDERLKEALKKKMIESASQPARVESAQSGTARSETSKKPSK